MKRIVFFSLLSLFSCSKSETFDQVKLEHPSSFREVLDRKGELLHETRVNFKRHRRAWTQLEELSPEFVSEIIRLEDKRFYSHPGIDPLAMMNAVREYPGRGASTITMQLAGMLHQDRGRRGIRSKLTQIKNALLIEMSWSKNEIIESWINLMTFKGELQGIRSASFSLFGKDPRGLDAFERTLLFAMIPSPNQSEEKLLKRSCRYLHITHPELACQELPQVLAKSSFSHPRTELLETHAPHLAIKVQSQKVDKLKTTVDKALQIEATQILRSHIRNLHDRNVKDGAVLVLDRKTGDVLAYVGSSGDFSSSSQVDHVQSLRQAGSTLKPLLYASAISHRLITMTTPLKDEPFSVTREGLTYQPENYQKGFTYQDVPAKVALGSSLNIPAVRVIDYLSPERFYNLLVDLEFRDLNEPEFYGHSMALGSVDVTLWDLTRSYLALAEGGQFRHPSFSPGSHRPLKKISDFNPDVSFILSHILSEKNNRHLTFGIQSTLSTDSWSAVKTGTSKDMRDNWCVGFTDAYVIGVWVGNSSGEPMWNVTGISGAAPIFSHLVTFLHQRKSSLAPFAPSGLVKVNEDYYIKGTEPRSSESLAVVSSSVAKIIFPQEGAQFAFDPEIPLKSQRVMFQSSRSDLKWKLNGIELSQTELNKGFSPLKQGRYKLELWDEKDKRDEVAFYVKTGKL